MASISYRRLGPNNEPIFGQTKDAFLTDIDAVAQAIMTRINLLLGEWWLDLQDGTPIWQTMLGVGGSGKNSLPATLALEQRIKDTPFVQDLSDVETSYNPNTRAFTFSCTVQTQFGSLSVSNTPTPQNLIASS